VGAHGFRRDLELAADFFVDVARGQEIEGFQFPGVRPCASFTNSWTTLRATALEKAEPP
jgi:hypothetical protein